MRRFVRLLVLCLMASQVAFAAPADSVATPPEPGVRTGTTEVDIPSIAEPAELLPHAPEVRPSDPSHVADAPRVQGTLKMPPPPEGFNRFAAGWVEFVYHPSIRERVQPLIAEASAIHSELRDRLGQNVLSRVRVQIARTPGEMATFAPAGAPFPEYAAGVAYSELGLILLTLTPVHPASNHNLLEIFKHELAHVALHDAVNGNDVPRWFNEGFAVLASGETSLVRLQTLWTATLADKLPSLRDMERSFPNDESEVSIAYAQAVDVVRFMVRDQEAHRFRTLISQLRDGKTLDRGVLDAYGTDLVTLEHEWREDVSKRYTFWPVLFSGSLVWAVALGLFFAGYRRRKRRDRVTLERWAREEAAEDAFRRRARAANAESARVHIVLARTAQQTAPPLATPEAEIPKVEHEGEWHTLH